MREDASTASSSICASVLAELERLGSETYRKTYRRHGAEEPIFGISFAHVTAIRNRLKVDHALEKALWDSGNFDARNLTTMLADPARLTPVEAERWTPCSRRRSPSHPLPIPR